MKARVRSAMSLIVSLAVVLAPWPAWAQTIRVIAPVSGLAAPAARVSAINAPPSAPSTPLSLSLGSLSAPSIQTADAPIPVGPALPASAILANSMRALVGLPKVNELQLQKLEQAFGADVGIRVALTNDAILLLSRIEVAKQDGTVRARLIEEAGGSEELSRREALARSIVSGWTNEVPKSSPAPAAVAELNALVGRLEAAQRSAGQGDALKIFMDGSALHAALYDQPVGGVPAVVSTKLRSARLAPAFKDDASARGQKVLLVGAKPAILKEARRVADALGFRLLLADDPKFRERSEELIPETDFIAVPDIDKHDRDSLHNIAETVARITDKLNIDRVITFTNAHLLAQGRIRDRIDAAGLARQSIERAYDKGRARRLFNRDASQFVRYDRVNSAAEAKEFFTKSGGGKKRPFVMKANRGDNGSFVLLDIQSAAQAEKAYLKLTKSLRAAAKSGAAGIFDVDPGVIMEEMLVMKPGANEVSVEIVMQNGEPTIAMVSDTLNFGPGLRFPGGSMTFPTDQTAEEQAFVDSAAFAVKALGIEHGNVRVDIIPTAEGPRVIEVNARMGGANIWKCVEMLTGANLIEQGFRALLGLRVDAGRKPEAKLVYSFISSRFTGKIQAIRGLEAALKVPGVRQIKLTAEPGDAVTSASGGAFQDLGEIIVTAKTTQEAKAITLKALRMIKIAVRQKSGKVVWQTADYMHAAK